MESDRRSRGMGHYLLGNVDRDLWVIYLRVRVGARDVVVCRRQVIQRTLQQRAWVGTRTKADVTIYIGKSWLIMAHETS